MYDQLMNDINRHIIVVWQSVGVLFAAFAALSLAEKKIIPVDLGITLIICVCGWVIANVYDASYWYNRNLVIIANIERQFLLESDLRDIHHYFGRHREAGNTIEHLRIQLGLAVAVAFFVLAYHFIALVLPTFSMKASIGWISVMPYAATVLIIFVAFYFRARAKKNYINFVKISPGKEMNTQGLPKDSGHPTAD